MPHLHEAMHKSPSFSVKLGVWQILTYLIELVVEISTVRRIKEVDFFDRALTGIGGFPFAMVKTSVVIGYTIRLHTSYLITFHPCSAGKRSCSGLSTASKARRCKDW